MLETIDSWEKRKKMKARRKLNKHEVTTFFVELINLTIYSNVLNEDLVVFNILYLKSL